MRPDEKLANQIDEALMSNENLKAMTSWEINFLRNIHAALLNVRGRGASPKQKAMAFKIISK
tara:strand:- start:3758 stop:3943 length:186 start_codon:yes stop_codon:yes gene_type:complete